PPCCLLKPRGLEIARETPLAAARERQLWGADFAPPPPRVPAARPRRGVPRRANRAARNRCGRPRSHPAALSRVRKGPYYLRRAVTCPVAPIEIAGARE